MSEPAVTAPPVPSLAGTFAIYEEPDGAFVLVTETTQHGRMVKRIPAMAVKLMSGKLAGIFGKE